MVVVVVGLDDDARDWTGKGDVSFVQAMAPRAANPPPENHKLMIYSQIQGFLYMDPPLL